METDSKKRALANLSRAGRPKGTPNRTLMAVINESPDRPLFFKSEAKAKRSLGNGSDTIIKKAVKNGKAVGRTKMFGIVMIYCGVFVKDQAEVMQKIQ